MSNDFIKIYKMEDSEDLKYQLLDLIKIQLVTYDAYQDQYLHPKGGQHISDYYISGERRGSEYKDFITNKVDPFIQDYVRFFGSTAVNYSNNWWFQQYTQGERHGWHDHSSGGSSCSISCIYYAELPDPREATEFVRYDNLGLEEGIFIVYPSFLPHRSPRIDSDTRKTIFACNIGMEFDYHYLKSTYSDR